MPKVSRLVATFSGECGQMAELELAAAQSGKLPTYRTRFFKEKKLFTLLGDGRRQIHASISRGQRY
jgi:hypothetical protein